jgi:hypothetical protein
MTQSRHQAIDRTEGQAKGGASDQNDFLIRGILSIVEKSHTMKNNQEKSRQL